VGTVYKAAQEAGYILLITADHGNAEQMKDPVTGNPHTAHTTNPVPFILTGDPKKLKFKEDVKKGEGEGEGEEDEAALCDVAPTILDIMVRASSWMIIYKNSHLSFVVFIIGSSQT
jgi:2,3-bisphosphoglycerate-independent phosphoglycerate mutase